MNTEQVKYLIVAIILLFALASCSEDTVIPDTIPPRVTISQPTPGIVVSNEVPINVYAEDNEGISKVEFYIDYVLIAEDVEEPYDQIWYSGFWEGGVEYQIIAIAYDINGNQKESDPIVVALQENSKYVPIINSPDEDQLFLTMDVDYSWDPVPGARGYILKISIPGYELNYNLCDDGTVNDCYVRVSETTYSKRLPFLNCCYFGIPIDVYISVRAYWTSYNLSEWSEERKIVYQAEPFDSLH